MLNNFKFSDYFMLAVIRDGKQKNYILHKANALLAMDAAWLLNPDGPSQAAEFLATREETAESLAPIGYGCVLVSFDDKTVYSYQVYKDISRFTLYEAGFYGGSAPAWMDWPRLIEDAFTKDCVTHAVYESHASGAKLRIDLPDNVRARRTYALRYASTEKPDGFQAIGLEFSPPKWIIRHEDVNTKSPQLTHTRVNNNLIRLRANIAPVCEWTEMQAA